MGNFNNEKKKKTSVFAGSLLYTERKNSAMNDEKGDKEYAVTAWKTMWVSQKEYAQYTNTDEDGAP